MDEQGNILKGAKIEKSAATDEVMQQINRFALSELSAEDVFTFNVRMCDNMIDRDFEAFTKQGLEQLAELFVGKTIIKDHRRTADNQIARIYATEIMGDETKQGHDGGEYLQVVAHCYMVKTAANADLIAEINAGIKKEVSVGFGASSVVCSICGADNCKVSCEHWWGEVYEGKQCYFMFDGVGDAYELSFVAVPAQREAGTVKSYNGIEKKKAEPVAEIMVEPVVDTVSDELEKRMRSNDAYLFLKSKKED